MKITLLSESAWTSAIHDTSDFQREFPAYQPFLVNLLNAIAGEPKPTMLSVDKFLDGVRDLPPAPRNLAHLMPLLDRGDVEVTQVADIIQFDPALTAQVMRLCNSGYSGSASPATDICEATTRVGFEEIFQIVSALSAAALMRSCSKDRAQRANELWRHSVTAALVGKLIALDRNQKTALVFTACILHDIGKIALARGLEAQYDDILAAAERSQTPVFVAEHKALGFDHAEVGGGRHAGALGISGADGGRSAVPP